MEPRRVELPRVAKRYWPKAIELIKALMRECATLEHEAWYLGGGTALAADWQHRTSTDIDILIAPGLSMSALGAAATARIDQLIEVSSVPSGHTRVTCPVASSSRSITPVGVSAMMNLSSLLAYKAGAVMPRRAIAERL